MTMVASMVGRRPAGALSRLIAVVLAAGVFFIWSASPAFGEIIVDLDGSGAGTVSSDPPGIECSNVGGTPPGPDCSQIFPLENPPGSGEFLGVKLAAAPDPDSYFAGWSGDDPFGGFLGPTCNEGQANPCVVADTEEFGVPQVHITATFEPLPDQPAVVTGGAVPGPNEFLTALQGTVNPNGAVVSDCYFEYGPTTKYGFKASCNPEAELLGEGDVPVPVSGMAELELLEPNTTYHYRVVASNLGGKSKGLDQQFTTGAPPSESELPPSSHSCSNAAIRHSQVLSSILLPDCMALEMVSPPRKGGQTAKPNQLAISLDGGRLHFVSAAPLGETPGGLEAGGDPYVATRGASGWEIASTSPPIPIVDGWEPHAFATSYSPDFGRWFQVGSTQSQVQVGAGRAFRAGLGGLFEPLSPEFEPLVDGERPDVTNSLFRGASADHSHLLFIPGRNGTAYLPGDPQESSGGLADRNTYVAQLDSSGQPSLQLLARDKAGKVWGGACGARLGGVRTVFPDATGERNQGAISSDGARIYLSARPDQSNAEACNPENKLRILERLEGSQGPWIGELFSSECDRPAPVCSAADGDDYYQGASRNGEMVYFTTNRQLADSDLDGGATSCSGSVAVAGCDLYLYDSTLPSGQRIIQVSAGEDVPGKHEAGKEAKVLSGVTGVSLDGSHVYFVAEGVITADLNPEGDEAQTDQPNLYAWNRATEQTAFIGTVAGSDSSRLWGTSSILPVPELSEGGDGHLLPFVSNAPLTADDSDGTSSDAFLYDASSDLLKRVSTAAPGGADNGPFGLSSEGGGGANPLTLGTDFAEEGRRVSEDGDTAVFITAEGLVAGDVNGALDRYMRKEGQTFRLPGVVDPSGIGLALSPDGSTAAFPTSTSLVPQDGDGAEDIYSLQAGGGFAEPPPPPEPCQPNESLPGPPCPRVIEPAPNLPNVNSEAPRTGNPKTQKPRCGKGKVRRKGRCVRKRQRGNQRANHNRRPTR